MRCDLVILGDTPDAWAAAEDAALLGWKTAVLRPSQCADSTEIGVAAVLHQYSDEARSGPGHGRPCDLWHEAIDRHERSIARLEHDPNVFTERGRIQFLDADTVTVRRGGPVATLSGRLLLVAVGTTGRVPRGMTLDRDRLFLPEDVPRIATAPRSLVVLGGNRTARAFARLFVAAGSYVRLIDGECPGTALPTLDRAFGEVRELRQQPSGVVVHMTDGRAYSADAVLFAANRAGATACLDLPRAGLEADEDGRLWCDETGRTWKPNILAVGDVVGYPRTLRDDPHAARRIAVVRHEHAAIPLEVA